MNKRVRIGLSEAVVDVFLKLGSAELVRQLHHNAGDPVLTEGVMQLVKANEKFNAVIREVVK
ncbi:MAG: hypothetical protein ABSF21_01010 [Dehalococcoidia bacterium]